MNDPSDKQGTDLEPADQVYLDLTEQRCPQTLLKLKRRLYQSRSGCYRVRLQSQSAGDVQRWLNMHGHQYQLVSAAGSCAEILINWKGSHA